MPFQIKVAVCISSKKGPSLSTQTYFSGRILCKRKHDLIFFLYKNDAKKKSRREEKKRNNPSGYLGQANGKTIMRKNGGGVFVGYVWGGCHSTWLHCEFLSLYKNLSLSPCLSLFFSLSSDLYGGMQRSFTCYENCFTGKVIETKLPRVVGLQSLRRCLRSRAISQSILSQRAYRTTSVLWLCFGFFFYFFLVLCYICRLVQC